MKATELRIGVIVDYDGPKPVTREDIAFLIFNISDVDGVPITEEWLVKFGFEKSTYSTDEDGHWDNGKDCIKQRYNKFGRADIFVDQVHQLQNLFYAITGEELTIKETA